MLRIGNRPVYLNLIQIRLPMAGFMSILHRVSGLFLFLAIPPLLYLLDLSLASPAGFIEARAELSSGIYLVALFVLFLGGFLGVMNATGAIDTGIRSAMLQP